MRNGTGARRHALNSKAAELGVRVIRFFVFAVWVRVFVFSAAAAAAAAAAAILTAAILTHTTYPFCGLVTTS